MHALDCTNGSFLSMSFGQNEWYFRSWFSVQGSSVPVCMSAWSLVPRQIPEIGAVGTVLTPNTQK